MCYDSSKKGLVFEYLCYMENYKQSIKFLENMNCVKHNNKFLNSIISRTFFID